MKQHAAGKKLAARKQRSGDEKREVAGKACLICRKSKVFFVVPSRTNQNDGENQRCGMELQETAHLFGFARIIKHIVGRQPKLSQPNV